MDMSKIDLEKKLKIRAIRFYSKHRSFWENWEHGNIKDIWVDEDGYLCIKYESGTWYHYKETEKGELEWW